MQTNIKAMRVRNEKTQKELADRLGTTEQTVARWETGRTQVPVIQLRELALIFSCSVDELLGKQRSNKRLHKSPFAVAKHECPFGTASVTFGFGSLDYPIDFPTRELIHQQFCAIAGSDQYKNWIEFYALNNKLVFLNPAAVRSVDIFSDDVQSMPEFQHPEIYLALDEHINILQEEQENGPELVKRVEEIAQALGEDGVIDLVDTIKMVYADGNSKTCSLNEDVASRIELFQVEGRLGTAKDNFFEIETECQSAFELINLTHVAVIEVALERYLRLIAELAEEVKHAAIGHDSASLSNIRTEIMPRL